MPESFINSFTRLEDWEQALLISSFQRVVSMMNATDLVAVAVLDSTNAQVLDE